MIERILVADDEPMLRGFLAEVLRRLGKEVVLVENGKEAIDRLKKEAFDLVLTDLKMPEKDGMAVLKEAKILHPSLPVIVATGHGTVEMAVEAMRQGAFHFLLKPFQPESIETLLLKLEQQLRLQGENRHWRESFKGPELIAISPAMQKVATDLAKIAKSGAAVFITGESGTGKEVVATTIHRLSTRASHPFIKVNCAAIPETLVESEFFGHERGAFTGALNRKVGRFELADQGTILLDEVTEIPLSLQPKLLRAVQEQEFDRVGGTKSVKVNVRLIAASNRNMNEAIAAKVFREDLYYRLNVIPIHLPPLRHRIEDILPLAESFLRKFCAENHKPLKILAETAQKKLLAYHWPGNVRELANIIERTVVMDFSHEIQADHLYLDATSPIPQKSSGSRTLHEVEKQHILETFRAQGENRGKTAAILGISVRTLRNKLHEYGVGSPEEI